MKNIFKLTSVFLTIALLVSVLLISGSLVSAEQKNLIVNGDFSDGLNGWTYSAYEDDWTVTNGKLIALANHGSKDDTLSPSFTEELKGETTYTLHVEISDLSGACVLRVNLDNNHEIADSPITATGDYTFTTYASTDLFKIKVFLPKNNSGATATFDNFILVEGEKIEGSTTASAAETETEATVTETATEATVTETATEATVTETATEATVTETATEATVTETGAEPSVTEPSETEPSETEPSVTEPSETEPSETEPSVTEPSETEPSETEPSETEPSETEPSETEPSETEPSQTEPSETEPSETEPSETEPSATETEPSEPVSLVETVLVENNVGGTKTLKPEKTDAWFLVVNEIKADAAKNGPIDPDKGEYYQITVTGSVDNGEADFHLGEGLDWAEYWGDSGCITTEESTVTAIIPVAIPAEGIGDVYLADSGEAGHTLNWTYAKVSVFRVGEPTEPSVEPTATEVEPTGVDVTRGDANNDGDINMKDVLTLRKYIAGIEVEINEAAADANADGDINMKDVLLLRKFIAGIVKSI